MVDPNIEQMADVLIHYSFERVDFRKEWEGKKKFLWITYEPPADELVQTVTEIVLSEGGHVLLDQTPPWWGYTFFTKASEDVLRTTPDRHLYNQSHAAARLNIYSSSNTKSLATVDPKRTHMYSNAYGPVLKEIMKVDKNGEFAIPWCSTLVPTPAYAQDMGLSFEECKAIIYKAMLLDEKNPIECWRQIALDQKETNRKFFEGSKTPNNSR